MTVIESIEIYVAVLEDRHIDIQIEPFRKPFHALKQIVEWQHGYRDQYEWIEEEIDVWEYYCRAETDDGPKMRIERKRLR